MTPAASPRRDSSAGDGPAAPTAHPTVGAAPPRFPGYDVRGELGRGGMGVVYRAFDERRGEMVALKTLLWGDPAALYRFKQEFRIFADLSHVNLVSLHELVSDGQAWFFTMELVEGVPFLDWVREDRARLRPALAQLFEGLAALHAAGRVHRDVKPSNVLVAGDGRVVVLDFGLAAELAADGLHRSTKSHVLGTVAYMSPEQASGRPVSAASDLYSAGVMLFEALTGRLPFEGDAVQILVDKRTKEAPRASAVASDVPADLDALCAELLARDPALRPAAQDIARRLVEPTESERVDGAAEVLGARAASRSLVGRDTHLAALEGALRALDRRRPVVVLVHGASGMGKSALVQTFLDETAVPRGAVVLAGRCYERESVPYKAFDSAMDALARHLARLPRLEAAALLPRDVATLTRVFPVLRRAEAVAAAPQPATEVVDPAEVRRRAFAALRELLARIADQRPLVLWADDLQWGDADSADLLTAVLRPPDPPALLFVGSYRREDAAASAFLATALRTTEPLAERVEIAVDPLRAAESALLAARLTGGDTERAANVARESGGSPFFVHELAEFGAGAAGDLTLDGAIAARVAKLSPDARALLECVAVSGGPVPLRSAIRAADADSSARAAVAALRAGRLVRVKGASPDEQLDTYHDRIRETLLARLPAETLRLTHRRLGVALELAAGIDDEKLAGHFHSGGEPARAGERYRAAAEKAVAALAFEHAARLFRLALETLAPSGADRRILLVKLADALRDARRGTEAAACYLDAARDAPRAELVELRQRAAAQLLTSGRIDQGMALSAEVLADLGLRFAGSGFLGNASIALRLALVELGGVAFRERSFVDAETALRIDALRGMTHGTAHVIPRAHYDLQSRYVPLALRRGDVRRARDAAMYHRVAMSAMRVPAARELEEFMLLAQREQDVADDDYTRAWCDLARGFVLYHCGSYERCREYSLRGVRAMRERCAGHNTQTNMGILYALWAHEYLGELPELERLAGDALADAEARSDLFLATAVRSRLSMDPLLVRDDPGTASLLPAEVLGRWARSEADLPAYWALVTTCRVALYRRDPALALRSIAEGWSPLRRAQHFRFPILLHELLLLRATASLQLAADDVPRRSSHLRAARSDVRRLVRSRTSYAPVWGRMLAACALSIEHRDEQAGTALSASETELTAVGMHLFAASLRRRRGELDGGETGRALVAESDARMTSRGIVRAERWADMLAPGARR